MKSIYSPYCIKVQVVTYLYNVILVHCVLLAIVNSFCVHASTAYVSELRSVCPGDQISLICNSSSMRIGILRWTIMLPQSVEPSSISRVVTNTRVAEEDPRPSPVAVNQTVTIFHVLRRSEYNTTPLVTSLLIENVSAGINGTIISCSSPNNVSEEKFFEFMIQVIGNHVANPTITVSNTSVELHRINDFVVVLEWVQEADLIYNISASPQAVTIALFGNTSVELTLLYNVPYSVSIAAVTPCGLNASTTTLKFNQTKCPYPLIHDSTNIQILDYMAPALESSQVSFSCSSGMVLTGPNTSMCASNGQWEPDPYQIRCKANCGPLINNTSVDFYYNSTLEGSVIMFICSNSEDPQTFVSICQKSASWDPDPISHCTSKNSGREVIIIGGSSGAVVVIFILIILFIFLIIKGIQNRKRSKSADNNDEYDETNNYDLLQAHPIGHHESSQYDGNSNYALLQASPTGHHESLQQLTSQVTLGERQTLVYADIGPLSFKRHPTKAVIPPDSSDRVEYAQVNQLHSIKKIQGDLHNSNEISQDEIPPPIPPRMEDINDDVNSTCFTHSDAVPPALPSKP